MEFRLLRSGGVFLYYALKSMARQPKQRDPKSNVRGAGNGIRIRMETTTHASGDYDEDDDLATFRISYGHDEEKSKNRTPGKWIEPGESVPVNGQVISKGNFYYGGQLKSLDGYGTDASLVDDTLKIEKQQYSYEDENLGYWPKFISLTPLGRGAYLDWLSSNRNDPDIPLGYVFIYF